MTHLLTRRTVLRFLLSGILFLRNTEAADTIRVLVLDGRNNHDWQNTSAALIASLKSSGRFQVEQATAPVEFPKAMPKKPKAGDASSEAAYEELLKVWKAEAVGYNKEHAAEWAGWLPVFKDYGVVVNNYNGQEWPQPMKDAFVSFVKGGGGS